jgi:hypothetical protein
MQVILDSIIVTNGANPKTRKYAFLNKMPFSAFSTKISPMEEIESIKSCFFVGVTGFRRII